MFKKIFYIILFFTCFLYSDIYGYSGTSALQFLKFSPSARASGMADAYSSISGDIDSLYYNPAGVYSKMQYDISMMYTKWFQDMSFLNFAGKTKLGKTGDIGVGIIYLDHGSIYKCSYINGELIKLEDKIKMSSYEIIGNYSRGFMEIFFIGVNFKFINERLHDKNSDNFAFDLGGIIKLKGVTQKLKNFNVGISLLNIGTKAKFDVEKYNLPMLLRTGLNYNCILGRHHKFIFACDMEKSNDSDSKFNLGFEYTLLGMLKIRSGYKIGAEYGNLKLGAGFLYKGVTVDYSFNQYGNLGTVNRIELGIKIKAKKKYMKEKIDLEKIKKEHVKEKIDLEKILEITPNKHKEKVNKYYLMGLHYSLKDEPQKALKYWQKIKKIGIKNNILEQKIKKAKNKIK